MFWSAAWSISPPLTHILIVNVCIILHHPNANNILWNHYWLLAPSINNHYNNIAHIIVHMVSHPHTIGRLIKPSKQMNLRLAPWSSIQQIQGLTLQGQRPRASQLLPTRCNGKTKNIFYKQEHVKAANLHVNKTCFPPIASKQKHANTYIVPPKLANKTSTVTKKTKDSQNSPWT